MKMFKRGKTWYVDFVDAQGRRQRPSTGQTEEVLARARAAELMHTAFVDNMTPDERLKMGAHLTLGVVLTRVYDERWKFQRGAKERSYQLALLIKDIGHWPLHMVTKKRLQDYAGGLTERGLKPATINRKLSMVKVAMADAADVGEVQGVPRFPFFTEDNEKERFVSEEEEQQILQWFQENTAPADAALSYFRDLFVVLIDTGMRASEGLGLIPERIVQDGTVIRLPKGTSAKSKFDRTKSGKGRTIPMTKRAQEAVGRLMANEWHRRHDGNWGSLRFGRIMDKIGLPDIGLHTLRHTYASRLVQRGVAFEVVQRLLGHANIKTTMRYAHLAPNNLADAISVLEPATDAPRRHLKLVS
jgi:integrase